MKRSDSNAMGVLPFIGIRTGSLGGRTRCPGIGFRRSRAGRSPQAWKAALSGGAVGASGVAEATGGCRKHTKQITEKIKEFVVQVEYRVKFYTGKPEVLTVY